MAEDIELERQLKKAARTGKYIVGRREVLGGVKGSKLLVWSASANVPQQILDECKSLSVPAVKFNGNPVELGHACGIPFRVSVIAVKAVGDADLSHFSNSTDYVSLSRTTAPGEVVKEEEAESTKEPEKEVKAEGKASGKRKPRKASGETKEKKAKPAAKPKKITRKKPTEKAE